MARLVFPDEGSRLVFRMTGSGKPLLSAAAATATIYVDSSASALADIQTPQGVTILTSTLTVTAASQLPEFLGPDGVDTVWASVDGGPVAPVYARADDRLDSLASSIGSLGSVVVKSVNGNVPDGSGNVELAQGAVEDATTTSKGVIVLAGDLGGTGTAPTTPTAVHKSGAEIINGIKTFNDKPVVPDASFALAKLATTGTADASTVLHGDGVYRAVSTSVTALGVVTRTTSHTIAAGDVNVIQVMDLGADGTLTLPSDAEANIAVGSQVPFVQRGVGKVTVVSSTAGGTVSVRDGSKFVSGALATSFALPMPVGHLAGDGILVHVEIPSSSRIITPPADFVSLGDRVGPSGATSVLFTKHNAPLSDAGVTKTFTSDANTAIVAIVASLANAHKTNFIDGVVPLGPTTVDDDISDTYTTVASGVLEVSVRGTSNGTTQTAADLAAPAGMTLTANGTGRTALADANSAAAMAYATAGAVAAGTTIGNRTWDPNYGNTRTIGIAPAGPIIVTATSPFATAGVGTDGVATKIGPNEWLVS